MITTTTPTPPAAAMADDLALRHGKNMCSNSRLGPFMRLNLTLGIKSTVRLDLGLLRDSVPWLSHFGLRSCL
jgi:hypothetical protein